ncbi:hypothetical protein RUM44_007134 [Polyplax serrata]|uniref:Exportin-5 n=1 Tax=Polyplax serrata TaxID=468196 RepID=A0ABR1B1H6_POLSC
MATPELINEISKELIRAIEVTMSPTASHAARQEAYTAYEQFKECSPYAPQVGLFLVQADPSQGYIVHFGLQLMEHCVKFRWNQISQPEKLFIKENTMRLLMVGAQKEPHMKDGLSRIIVEMVKREWPQQWPTLMAELNMASAHGATQAETVLLIFLRLCEDVVILQTLESAQRKKDISQALTTNMSDIFSFIIQLITCHVDLFKKAGNLDIANDHYRVVQTGLQTLSCFVEWVNYTYLGNGNNAILVILCNLLEDDHFQIGAVDCLLQIVSRKGPLDERKFLLEWFDLKALKFILSAASNVSSKSLNENNYLFLKKLTQVLTGLGAHFCTIWGKEETGSPARSEHLDIYLSVMLIFSRHPSLSIISYANTVWSSFFKHQVISRDPVFKKYIPQWFETAAPKIIKVAYPASRIPTTDQDMAILLDFDSEEEFTAFLLKTRTELLETFRKATDIVPYVTYTYVEKWFRTVLQQSAQELSSTEANFCTLSSPLYLQWEAMANLFDRVLGRLVHIESQARPSVTSGLELLELCLNFNPIDPLILSVLLSCISALFVFLSMATAEQSVSILPRVLDKIFAASVFLLPGQTKETRSRAVQNVRRHASALLVKIGQRYPLLLLPLFDQINATVQNITKDPQLSKMEQVTLQEALLLICNHFNEFNKQSQFVGDVIRSGVESWVEMQAAFRTVADFMTYVGLDKPPVEPNSEDITGKNRSQLLFCTHLFYSVLLRSTWPEDPDRAARGGFVIGRTSVGNPIYRNPAAPHIIPLLPNILALIGVLNALWTPEAIARLSDGYKGVHQMLETERANLLSLVPHSSLTQDQNDAGKIKVQSPLERMQQFLLCTYDNCYHILGTLGPSLGQDFYQIPDLSPAIINSIFSNLEHVADYKIRIVIRTFFKSFILSCPKAYYKGVLLPVLNIFLPYMLTRLTKKWEYLLQLRNESNADEDSSDAQEVLEEKLHSMITSDYSDVLKICLIGGSRDNSYETEAMDQDDAMETLGTHRNVNHVLTEAVSELGLILIREEGTKQVIILTLLRFLTWSDSSASMKAAGLLHSVVRQLATDDALTEEIVIHITTTVLQALQIHGHYDPAQGLLLTLGPQLYELLRPKFPSLLKLLMQIPNVNQQDLQRFDDKIMNATQASKISNKVDKSTRDLFRKITHPVSGPVEKSIELTRLFADHLFHFIFQLIGRSLGELFKKEVKIMDLPELKLPKKKRNTNFNFDYGPEMNRLLT